MAKFNPELYPKSEEIITMLKKYEPNFGYCS